MAQQSPALNQKHKEVIEVYRHIIETVVSRIEPTFRNMGLEAVVVDELKTNWEHRLAQTMKDNIGENNGQGEEDWADGDDAEQHPVQYLAPPPMAPAPVQQQQYLQQGGPARPQPIAAPQQRLAYPNQYQYQQQQQYDAMPNQIPKPVALPRPPMQQQRPKPGQYDGPSSAAPVSDPEPNKFTQEEIDRLLVEQFAPRLAKLNANRAKMAGTDGPKGSSEDEDEDDDGLDDGLDEKDNEIGSDLDSDEDERTAENVILCQYEHQGMKRVKNRYKFNFKDGVAHIHGRDYLFHKGNGEFDWT